MKSTPDIVLMCVFYIIIKRMKVFIENILLYVGKAVEIFTAYCIEIMI